MAMQWGKRVRKRLLAEDVPMEEPGQHPDPDPVPVPPEDPDDDEDSEEEEDDKPIARAVPGGISKLQREARMEGYKKGYEEAYKVARQFHIAEMSLQQALPYLQHGYSLEAASEEIAEIRAQESNRTAIRSESMPNTGTKAEPPRKTITAKDRAVYTANFNKKQAPPIPLRMP